jgi:hypothetical protein
MDSKELEISNKSYDTLAVIAIGFGVMTFSGFGLVLLGVLTRVFGICSGASDAWTAIYGRLWFLLPVLGTAAGFFAHHKYSASRRGIPTSNIHSTDDCR